MRRDILLFTSLLLAFSLMNLGFAGWSGNFSIKPMVQTGRVSWGFDGSLLEQGDKGPDLICGPGLTDVRLCTEGKDVGRTDLFLGEGNGDHLYQKLNIAVSNAYPCYYNRIAFGVLNCGEVLLNIDNAVITWGGSEQILTGGTLYYFCSDGKIVADSEEASDPVFEVRWNTSGTETSNLQNPDEVIKGFLEFHLLPAVLPSHTYNFSVALAAKAADPPVDPGEGDPTEPGGGNGGSGGNGGNDGGSAPGPADSGDPLSPPEVMIVPDEPAVVAPPEVQPPGAGQPLEPVQHPKTGKPEAPTQGQFPRTGGDVAAFVYTGIVLIALGAFLSCRD